MKKIVSVLLCLVMMMSLCTAAFAAGTDYEYCECGTAQTGQYQVDNKDGTTHRNVCKDCNKTVFGSTEVPHNYWYNKDADGKLVFNVNYDGEFCICGAEKTAQKPECKHEDWGAQKLVDNGDGTHNAYCSNPDCGELMSENIPHSYIYENNTKCLCGAVKPVTTYTVTYVPGDTGIDKNGMPKDTEKYESGDMAVLKKMPATTTIPEGYTFIGWTDGVKTYEAGARVVITGNLELTPVLVKQSADCKHDSGIEQKLVPNADGKTHNAYCPECDELMSENIPHSYWYNNKGEYVGEGGTQCRCGYNCKHDNGYVYTDKGDGVHHEGFCADCGKHIATEDGEHSDLYFVNNKNGRKGTHTAFCGKCGAEAYTEHHNFKGSKCVDCGAKKSTSSAGGSTTTTTTTTNTTKSPKTGDMGVVLYAATALLSLSGTAVVIKKRKNDK